MRRLQGVVRVIRIVLTVMGAFGVLGAAPISASASAAPMLSCRKSVTHLVDRPQPGNHGIWAAATLTRTTTICESSLPFKVNGRAVQHYRAAVKDAGEFKTIAGAKSPQAGVTMASRTGTVVGGFTASFTSAPDFQAYSDVFGGHTYHGTAPIGTADWVKAFFKVFDGSSLDDDWSWTYRTIDCDRSDEEQWIDAARNGHGSRPADGDITGKKDRRCPSPTPSSPGRSHPSPSPSSPPPSHRSTPTGSTPPVTLVSGTPTTSTPGLPETGADPES